MSKNKIYDTNSHITGLYELDKTIGQGHFAIVKSARHVFSGERVAIKIIDKLKLDHVSRDHLFQEVKCMKLVQHPNVVRLYEVIDTPSKLYLVLELGDGGDMYDYIMKHSNGLSETKAKGYFKQIVRAIKYCHDLRVVHRDLKPENVVFFQQTGQVKLTDFGFSNIYDPNSKLLTSCGSLAYSAPEILLGDSYYAPPVDIWSLGVILYMLVTGRAPFQEANDSETLTMILDCKYYLPDFLSIECNDLISRMIVRDPSKRINLDDICKHEWLKMSNESMNHLKRKDSANMSSNDELESDFELDLNSNTKLTNQLEHQENDLDLKPLVKRELISKKDNELIIKQMIDGKIANKDEIESSLDQDNYNYITATYYLLAERLLKKEYMLNKKKKKVKTTKDNTNTNNNNSTTKRKVLNEIATNSSILNNNSINNNNNNMNNNNSNVSSQSSVLSKNQFNSNILKMQQRNLLLRQDQAMEEDEDELAEEDENLIEEEQKIQQLQQSTPTQLTNIIEDVDEEEEEVEEEVVEDGNEEEDINNKKQLNSHLQTSTSSTTTTTTTTTAPRRSSRGAILNQTGDTLLSKLTIPEEEVESEQNEIELDNQYHILQRQLSPSIIKSLKDEAYSKLNFQNLNNQQQQHQQQNQNKDINNTNQTITINTRLKGRNRSHVSSSGADTSDSETETNKKQSININNTTSNLNNKEHDWNRSSSSSSRSRAKFKSSSSSNQYNRPLSVSSDSKENEQVNLDKTNSHNGQLVMSPNSKTLSVEHRLANMSQMSISSQLSKNNSFRYHRATLTGSETPNQLFNQQQISSTTPTPRESIVFNRGDEKPIAKILQQHQQHLQQQNSITSSNRLSGHMNSLAITTIDNLDNDQNHINQTNLKSNNLNNEFLNTTNKINEAKKINNLIQTKIDEFDNKTTKDEQNNNNDLTSLKTNINTNNNYNRINTNDSYTKAIMSNKKHSIDLLNEKKEDKENEDLENSNEAKTNYIKNNKKLIKKTSSEVYDLVYDDEDDHNNNTNNDDNLNDKAVHSTDFDLNKNKKSGEKRDEFLPHLMNTNLTNSNNNSNNNGKVYNKQHSNLDSNINSNKKSKSSKNSDSSFCSKCCTIV